MNETLDTHTVWILLLGLIVISSGLIETGFQQFKVPVLVGYLLLGMSLSLIDTHWAVLSQSVRNSFSFLADIGVITLLFKVGLKSHPAALARKLPQALKVWIGDVSGSALLGFAASHYLLKLQLIPSLIVTTALTATSVGVSVAAWQNRQALESDKGQLLLDIAELDDISAITLMALLFALVPILHQGHTAILPTLGFTGAGIPALLTSGVTGAALTGVSMIPRAEIAMIVVHQARQLGDWAMPERIYAAMVFVSMTTCIAAPWRLYRLLQRWPQTVKGSS